MSTTGQPTARTLSDEETLHLARLAAIGKIADKHPRFQHIDDHDHPILIGKTSTNHGVIPIFLVWTPWGVSGELDEHAHQAANAAIDRHGLNPALLHFYAHRHRLATRDVIWSPTAGHVEPRYAHNFIEPIDRHFADDPDQWTAAKAADRLWHVVNLHGDIVTSAKSRRAAWAEIQDGFYRRLWHERRAWYLEQPGRDHRSRPLTAHERAYIKHILQTREPAA